MLQFCIANARRFLSWPRDCRACSRQEPDPHYNTYADCNPYIGMHLHMA